MSGNIFYTWADDKGAVGWGEVKIFSSFLNLLESGDFLSPTGNQRDGVTKVAPLFFYVFLACVKSKVVLVLCDQRLGHDL